LFLGGERRRLTLVTVGLRLAARATASSEVKEWGSFNLELVWDRIESLRRGWSGVPFSGNRVEAC
jgi:hypothetical protein